MTAIVSEESTRLEKRFTHAWRSALSLIPVTVLATAAFVYLIAGFEDALVEGAGWEQWQARMTVAAILALTAIAAGFFASRNWGRAERLSAKNTLKGSPA